MHSSDAVALGSTRFYRGPIQPVRGESQLVLLFAGGAPLWAGGFKHQLRGESQLVLLFAGGAPLWVGGLK
ncbi:MAG: hypothetical protein KDD59_14415, partial [Bdellovibrionales bacterium]|nr:hypothetical protein [Bdellovibrionales bacterium]